MKLESLLELLRKYNNGSVSGSGSCLFSIFDDEESAIKISELFTKEISNLCCAQFK
jgi:4-diphosphocytidyl-2C-methyl-D-erythritol kinase